MAKTTHRRSFEVITGYNSPFFRKLTRRFGAWIVWGMGCLETGINNSVNCKLISLSFCFIASICYAQPVLVFYPNWIRILIPAFVCGFVVVDVAELVANLMGYEHVFIEIMLSGIGCVVSFICGVFEVYQWAAWFFSVMDDDSSFGWQELALALSCLGNSIILLIDFLRYLQPGKSQITTVPSED